MLLHCLVKGASIYISKISKPFLKLVPVAVTIICHKSSEIGLPHSLVIHHRRFTEDFQNKTIVLFQNFMLQCSLQFVLSWKYFSVWFAMWHHVVKKFIQGI